MSAHLRYLCRQARAACGAAAVALALGATADASTEVAVEAGSQSVIVPPSPVRRAAVADPAIADVELVNPSEVLVIGKHPGATDLALWVDGEKQPHRYSVTVGAASLG